MSCHVYFGFDFGCSAFEAKRYCAWLFLWFPIEISRRNERFCRVFSARKKVQCKQGLCIYSTIYSWTMNVARVYELVLSLHDCQGSFFMLIRVKSTFISTVNDIRALHTTANRMKFAFAAWLAFQLLVPVYEWHTNVLVNNFTYYLLHFSTIYNSFVCAVEVRSSSGYQKEMIYERLYCTATIT